MTSLKHSLWCLVSGFALLIGCTLTIRPDVQPGIPLFLGMVGFGLLLLTILLLTEEGH